MGRMSCEEWLARLRRSISGSSPAAVLWERWPPGRLDRRARPHLVTVEEFHRECVLALDRNAVQAWAGIAREPDGRGNDG